MLINNNSNKLVKIQIYIYITINKFVINSFFDGLHSSHAFIHIEFINPERYKQKGAFNDAYFDCTTTFPGESIRIPSNLQYGQSIHYFKQNQLPFIPFYRLENSNKLPFKLKNNSELVVSDGFQDKLLVSQFFR